MSAIAVVVTAAMIRIVALPLMWRHTFCEVCGEEMMYRVESGECLCGSCLVERRRVWREQTRPARQAAFLAKMEVEHAERRAARQALLDFEGDVPAVDLAKDGYFDVVYEEYVGSETVGPKPRWVVESTLTDHVQVRPASLMRAIFCLMVGRTIPFILRGALRNAKIQLDEAWVVSNGYRDVVEMYDGTDDRDMGDDVMAWLHRDPSAKAILNRWHRPDDELQFMDRLREEGRESEWWELMVDFRRRKLDGLLKEYFGLDDYRASMIVLKWEKGSSGRWKPAQQMNAVDWVKWSCEQSGSILGGLQSCTRSIQVKTLLRKRKEAAATATLEPKVAPAENQRVEIRDGKPFVVTVLPEAPRQVEVSPVGLRPSVAPSSDEVSEEEVVEMQAGA